MRLRLDDNERGAFHYLFGGVIVVVLLKGVAFITDRLGPTLTPDQAALRYFQQGYPLLRGEIAMVATPTGLTERLVLAVVLAVGVAFALALVFVIIATARRRRAIRAARVGLLTTRATLLATLAWSVYAAFLLPIKETRAEKGELIFRERTSMIGDIPWPFTLHEHLLPGSEVLWIEGGSEPPVHGQQGMAWVDVVTTSGIIRTGWVRGFDGKSEMKLLEASSDAAASLERELR